MLFYRLLKFVFAHEKKSIQNWNIAIYFEPNVYPVLKNTNMKMILINKIKYRKYFILKT